MKLTQESRQNESPAIAITNPPKENAQFVDQVLNGSFGEQFPGGKGSFLSAAGDTTFSVTKTSTGGVNITTQDQDGKRGFASLQSSGALAAPAVGSDGPENLILAQCFAREPGEGGLSQEQWQTMTDLKNNIKRLHTQNQGYPMVEVEIEGKKYGVSYNQDRCGGYTITAFDFENKANRFSISNSPTVKYQKMSQGDLNENTANKIFEKTLSVLKERPTPEKVV